MHHDDFFEDHPPSSNVGPYQSQDPFAGFSAEVAGRPEDPLAQAEESCITYKIWALRIFWPVLAIIITGAVFQNSLAQFGLNLLLPIVVLYQTFAISKTTVRWWWQCRSWEIVERRIQTNFAGAGFVSLALLLIFVPLKIIALVVYIPILGGLILSFFESLSTRSPGLVLMGAAFYLLLVPVVAQAVVRALFAIKNRFMGSSLSDPYEHALYMFDMHAHAIEVDALVRVSEAATR